MESVQAAIADGGDIVSGFGVGDATIEIGCGITGFELDGFAEIPGCPFKFLGGAVARL